jgi:hypothetical protein
MAYDIKIHIPRGSYPKGMIQMVIDYSKMVASSPYLSKKEKDRLINKQVKILRQNRDEIK